MAEEPFVPNPANQDPAKTGTNPPVTDDKKPVVLGSGTLPKRVKHIFVIPPHPNTKFDEENFLTLLEGSISLTMEEKKRVIEAIPRLAIEQINELIKIFEEEKQKFAELEGEFKDDVDKLKNERTKEMEMTEKMDSMKKEENAEADEEAAEAAKLKAQLMKDAAADD
jgi:ATP-dependent Lon protease